LFSKGFCAAEDALSGHFLRRAIQDAQGSGSLPERTDASLSCFPLTPLPSHLQREGDHGECLEVYRIQEKAYQIA
jgi:hypothetical protein